MEFESPLPDVFTLWETFVMDFAFELSGNKSEGSDSVLTRMMRKWNLEWEGIFKDFDYAWAFAREEINKRDTTISKDK